MVRHASFPQKPVVKACYFTEGCISNVLPQLLKLAFDILVTYSLLLLLSKKRCEI